MPSVRLQPYVDGRHLRIRMDHTITFKRVRPEDLLVFYEWLDDPDSGGNGYWDIEVRTWQHKEDFSRYSPNEARDLHAEFSFSDLSTATLFRLRFSLFRSGKAES